MSPRPSLRHALRLAVHSIRGQLHPFDAVQLAAGRRVSGTRAELPRFDSGAPVLVLSPHLDDAVLSCWSVLSAPIDVAVANVFSGVPPPGTLSSADRLAGALESADRMRERIREDAMALALVDRVPHNIGFPAFGYPRRTPSLAQALALIAHAVPLVSRVVGVVGIGANPDHVAIRRLGRRLAASGIPTNLYADLPYAAEFGWPPWVTGEPGSPYIDVDCHWRGFMDDELDLSPERAEVIQFTPDQVTAKIAAMRTYATQYPSLAGGSRDWLAEPAVIGYEVNWPVDSPGGRVSHGQRYT